MPSRFPVLLRHLPRWPIPRARHCLELFAERGGELSGDVPLQVGQTCSLTVNLLIEESIVVAAAVVRWSRGQEFAVKM